MVCVRPSWRPPAQANCPACVDLDLGWSDWPVPAELPGRDNVMVCGRPRGRRPSVSNRLGAPDLDAGRGNWARGVFFLPGCGAGSGFVGPAAPWWSPAAPEVLWRLRPAPAVAARPLRRVAVRCGGGGAGTACSTGLPWSSSTTFCCASSASALARSAAFAAAASAVALTAALRSASSSLSRSSRRSSARRQAFILSLAKGVSLASTPASGGAAAPVVSCSFCASSWGSGAAPPLDAGSESRARPSSATVLARQGSAASSGGRTTSCSCSCSTTDRRKPRRSRGVVRRFSRGGGASSTAGPPRWPASTDPPGGWGRSSTVASWFPACRVSRAGSTATLRRRYWRGSLAVDGARSDI
mmetsp:Transcript_37605/g.98494  ORF Transcript_37605/g.98494 Transcript_37605/m.98494 type:complete len:356 (+) Transcript_37605:172-1239(+)